jgi:hypothetical protein
MPICEVHKAEMKLVPAGVSKKTGRPYDAFYACQIQDCKYRPPRENQYSPPQRAGSTKREETDWGAIGKQKALCGMVNGMLSAGVTPEEVSKSLLALNGILNRIQTLSGVPAMAGITGTGETVTADQAMDKVRKIVGAPSDDYDQPPLEAYEEGV